MKSTEKHNGKSTTEFMNVNDIMSYLPHRYPFLLVDKVLECTPGESVVVLKNVTVNEPCFTGHFPENPVMPGVLILEALAQASGILAIKTNDEIPGANRLYYFMGIDKARFRKVVRPGDQLILKVDMIKAARDIYKTWAVAEVDGEVVAEAQLMCIGQDTDDAGQPIEKKANKSS